jgi:ribulose bisphosphate carboxylase small subunit
MTEKVTKEDALEALDNIDDYARMAGIDPIGPYKVLKDFIEKNSSGSCNCRGNCYSKGDYNE